MPQAVDIVANNGAATPVAKTFSLITPAASDGSSAIWWLREGANSGVFPTLEISARKNASKNARKCDITVKVPYGITDTALNVVVPGSSIVFNGTVTVPNDYPELNKADAVAYIVNLMGSVVVKACVKDGISAT